VPATDVAGHHRKEREKDVSVAGQEQGRLQALYSYGLLDAVRPVVLDDLTRLASRIFDTPMSTVTLIDRDRQWFAGNTGMSDNEGPRNIAFCAYLVDHPRPLIVPDATLDPRFRDYRNVTGAPFIRFYAGVPLLDEDGHVLGSVCVLDRMPRRIGDDQVALLGEFSAQAAGHIAAYRERNRLSRMDAELDRLARRQDDFVAAVSHELRTPVATMQGYLEMLAEEEDLAPYRAMLEPIKRNGDRLIRMVDHLLAGAAAVEQAAAPQQGPVDVAVAVRQAVGAVETRDVRVTLTGPDTPAVVVADRAALTQAIEQVVRNAVAFSAADGEVRVRTESGDDGVRLEVADDGAGIPTHELPYVFERFYRGQYAQDQAVPGMGLGLSIAWRTVLAHDGRLTVTSPGAGEGTVAEMWLPAGGPTHG
jgi:signal transduction histidine kinase